MDYIKLAQRTISMLNSMIESGECHTTRTREMVNNAQNGLEKLRQYNVVGRSEQCAHTSTDIRTLRCNCCNDCGEILDVLD